MKNLAVFDLDGTLHHTELALAPAIAMTVADMNGSGDPDITHINSLYGEPLEEFCRVLLGRNDRETFQLFMKGLRRYQKETIPRWGALYPGVVEMLDEAASMGYLLAVLSNAHMDYIEEVTSALGIRNRFSAFRGRGEVASKTGRLEELSMGFDLTVMVGDRYHDVNAAMELGLPAIGCAYGYGKEEELEGSVQVRSPAEITAVLKGLLSPVS